MFCGYLRSDYISLGVICLISLWPSLSVSLFHIIIILTRLATSLCLPTQLISPHLDTHFHSFILSLSLSFPSDADVYVWDLRHTGRCVNRFKHDDGTCTSSLGLLSHNPSSGDGNGYMAVGAESGVVTLFKGDFRSRFHGVGISRYCTLLYSIGPLSIF